MALESSSPDTITTLLAAGARVSDKDSKDPRGSSLHLAARNPALAPALPQLLEACVQVCI